MEEDVDEQEEVKEELPEVVGGAGCSRTRGGGIGGVLVHTDRPAGTTDRDNQLVMTSPQADGK